MSIPSLKEVTLSPEYNINAGDRVMRVHNGCLMSIQIPKNVRITNFPTYSYSDSLSFSIPTQVTKLSDYCFINWKNRKVIKGLERIKEFGNCSLNDIALDSEYSLYETEDIWKAIYGIDQQHRKQLEQWTQGTFDAVIFDTNVDDWRIQLSTFQMKTRNTSKMIFLIEDATGELFGYYLDTVMKDVCYSQNKTNKHSFQFNLNANGRLSNPMKYEIIDNYWGGIVLGALHERFLVKLGNIVLNKYEEKESSFIQMNGKPIFDYHGIRKPLSERLIFNPRRLVVIEVASSNKRKK